MPTPDFEDIMERDETPFEDTTDVEAYLDYWEEELDRPMRDEYGNLTPSGEVVARMYGEKYDYLPQLDIRAIEYHGVIRGVEYVDTRYGIKGYPGLWGRESMLEIARDIAVERDLLDIVDYLETIIAREGE